MTSQLTASKPLPATKPVTLATAVDGTQQPVGQPAVAIKADLNPLPSKRPAKIAKNSQKQTFPDDEKTLDGNKLVEGEELVQDGVATASTSLPADSGAAADLGVPAQGAAVNTPSAFASGISSESMLIAQLELPTIPSQSISSGVSASGAAASSSFGSLAGIFGAAAGGGLALGGGGGGRSAGPLPLPELDGRLVNGYIAGARVFQDLDGDGVFDSNEPNALTNEDGGFTLVGATQNGGSLIAMPTDDTIDKSTGLPVTSWFKAPADAAVISPLSTLVEAGLSEEELKAAFGIDGSVSILDFDPVEAVKGAGSVDAANLALKIKSANVVVSNLMDIGSSLAEGAGASSNSSDVSDMFVSSLVSTIKSNPSSEMNFEDAGLIFDIFDGALDGLGIDADLSEVTTAASARLAESAVALNANATVTDLNDAISKLTSISMIEKAIQDTVAASVKNAVVNPSLLQALKDINFEEVVRDVRLPESELTDLQLFSSVDAAEDLTGLYNGVTPFDSGATFEFANADDPYDAFTRVGSVTSGNGYTVQVAFAAFQGLEAGFADGYEAFGIKVADIPNDRLIVKLIGGGNDSVAEIDLTTYASSTDLGNGWFDVAIPLAEFSNQANIAAHTGLLIGMPGDNGATQFTFYFTDVELLSQVPNPSPEPEPEPELTDLQLFSSVDAAEDLTGLYNGVTPFDSGATFEFANADDPYDAFTRVGSVTSGNGYTVQVAFAAFQGLEAGFADGYEAFGIKVADIPNDRLIVKLIGGGNDSVAEIDLTTYASSTDLGNGWFDVAIPLAEFSNQANIAAHTGLLIGMPGDNGATQFTFYFTDVELLSQVPNPSPEPEPEPELTDLQLFSSVDAAEDLTGLYNGVTPFDSGATFEFANADDPYDAFTRVGSVTSGNGYTVQVAFAAFQGLEAGFADGYEAFGIKVADIPNDRLIVKLIGGGNDSVAEIDLTTYASSTDLGNGWFDVAIPLAEFSNQANIAAHTGLLIGMPGDNGATQFTFYFTDVELLSQVPNPSPEPEPEPELTDLQLFSSVDAAEDLTGLYNGVTPFDSGATFEFANADDPYDAFTRVGSVTSGNGYTVQVAFAAFQGLEAGFADGYEAFGIKVADIPNDRLIVKLIGGGNDSVAEIDLTTYASSTDLGNGWFDVAIPLAEFSNQANIAAHTGLLIGMPGDNGATQFTFYFTDVELLSQVPNPSPEPEPEPELTDLQLFSSVDAAEDLTGLYNGVTPFDSGATFEFANADDPYDAFTRVGSVTSGNGYTVQVAFAAFQGLEAGFADGYEAFGIKVADIPNDRLIVKLIGGGNDSVAEIDLTTYASSTDLGNGWFDVAIPLAEFSNQANIAAHTGLLIGMPGDNGATQFTFYFTDVELLTGVPTPSPGPDTPPAMDLQLFSSVAPTQDYDTQFAEVATFGNGATFNFVDAVDPAGVYDRVGSVLSGEGYAPDVNVAFAAFTAVGAGFADGYDAINLKVRNTPNGRLEVKLFGSGSDSVANIDLATYDGSTDLGNGWFDVAIPLADFTNPTNVANHSGYLIGMPGNNGATQFTFYFTDVELSAQSSLPNGYQMVWGDEFGGAVASDDISPESIDHLIWGSQTGGGGWGNNESQTYTNSLTNAYVQNGVLHIEAEQTSDGITSARLKSIPDVGPNSYVEVRAKVPVDAGSWPAIWLLGQDKWPDSGEIDIMEWSSKYFEPNETQAAIHTPDSYGDTVNKGQVLLETPVTEFQTYQAWWTDDRIQFGVNGHVYYTYDKPENSSPENWPFTEPMDMILNLAIGGTLGGAVPSNDFNYEMMVDYVRVYQLDPDYSVI